MTVLSHSVHKKILCATTCCHLHIENGSKTAHFDLKMDHPFAPHCGGRLIHQDFQLGPSWVLVWLNT